MHQSAKHELEPIILGHACKLWRCSCGTYHLQINQVSLKICQATFLELSRTVGLAAHPLLMAETGAN